MMELRSHARQVRGVCGQVLQSCIFWYLTRHSYTLLAFASHVLRMLSELLRRSANYSIAHSIGFNRIQLWWQTVKNCYFSLRYVFSFLFFSIFDLIFNSFNNCALLPVHSSLAIFIYCNKVSKSAYLCSYITHASYYKLVILLIVDILRAKNN